MHADEDKKKQELIEARNIADTLIYTTEKMFKDLGDKVKPEDKTAIEEKIVVLKGVKDADDVDAIKKATDELGELAQKVGAAMYEQKQQDASGQPAAEGSAEKKDSVEGEIVQE